MELNRRTIPILIALFLSDFLKKSKKIIVVVIAFLFIVQTFFAFSYMNSLTPYSSIPNYWNEMYDDLPENAVLFAWWDYGHWTTWNGFKTISDNTNLNISRVVKASEILSSFDEPDFPSDWQVSHVAMDSSLLIDKKTT